MKGKKSTRRYGANLLFQYGLDGHPVARPLCEKRIVVVEARTPSEALRRAKRAGRAAQLSYRNADGARFRIRFLGLVDLVELIDDGEAYYSMFRSPRPAQHLTSDRALAVFRPQRTTIGSAWWAVPAWAAASPRKRTQKPTSATGSRRARSTV